MMTTMCAIVAGLPLAIETGAGSDLRRPLGIAIVGGLLVSQFLTLYTTPIVYLYLYLPLPLPLPLEPLAQRTVGGPLALRERPSSNNDR